jgi:YYY domain-containing protein
LLGLAYLVYAPSSYGISDFTRPTVAAALALMVAVGAIAGYIWRAEVVAFVRERWRFLLLCEAIFLGMFLFSYWLRVNNPDLYHPFQGGEKPMDFTYFNGTLRTTNLEQGVVDPWYAGGYINYYWWGFFVAAVPTKLLGIVPEVAYNLAVPMFYATAAAATFSVGYNLSEATRRFMRRRPNRSLIGGRGPIFVGLLAIFLVLVAGNLRAVDYLYRSFGTASPWHPDIPLLGPAIVIFGGFWECLFGDASFRQLVYGYDWWGPSRSLSIIPTPENGVQPITEFPFWTFLFADMHAHLMAIPFALAAVGVALGIALNYTRLNPLRAEGRRFEMHVASWVMVAVIGLIVGALRWINSWDYPVFLALGASAILIAEVARERRLNGRGVALALFKIVVMGGLSYVLFAVVARNYSTEYGSIGPSNQTTDLGDFFTHWGVFLFFVAGFGLFALNRVLARDNLLRYVFFGGRRPTAAATLLVLGALVLLGLVVTGIGASNRSGPATMSIVGVVGILLCVWREVRSPSPLAPVMLFVYLMTGLGLSLTAFVEIRTLEGDVGRTNTVFKFYLHVWLLWGIVSAYALWLLFDVMRPHEALLRRAREITPAAPGRSEAIFALGRTFDHPGALPGVPSANVSRHVLRYAFAGGAAALIVLTLVFPYFGTRARWYDRDDAHDWQTESLPASSLTNDGLDWMERVQFYNQEGGRHELKYTRDAITWAREHIEGSPTTIEAVGPLYRSLGSRFAINTGLPTVAAWDFHQRQQRGKFDYLVTERQADVRMFYETADIGEAQRIIDKYDVEWVIVGDEEAFNYPESGLAKFVSGLNGRLELAYENPAIRIFHVIPKDELDGATATAP